MATLLLIIRQRQLNIGMQEESSSEDIPSISPKHQHRAYPYNQKSQPIMNYMDIIRKALKNYQDVNEEDFVLIDEGNENPFQHSAHTYMNNYHRTLVPIGANFQVIVPPILTESAYKIKSRQMMKTLRILKINDPEQGEGFYNKYFELIESSFGPGRSYEDVNHLRNALKRMESQLSFEEYLSKYSKYWQNYFKTKDRATAPKVPVKKKKKRGTIPI